MTGAIHAVESAQIGAPGCVRTPTSTARSSPSSATRLRSSRGARYFGRGRCITFCVWTSDQHTHNATRVVRTTVRDATYVRDGILDNQTELPIEKHTTDAAGYSDLVFALFDLLGPQFAPHLAGLREYRPCQARSASSCCPGRWS
jgi:TnpA family transposase